MEIYFICTGNSFRSPTAEALAKKYKPEINTKSAGIKPAGKIASNAIELLKKEDSEKFVKTKPEKISEKYLEKSDQVIVMEKEHKEHLLENFDIRPEKVKNWDIEDPINPDVSPEEAFQSIKSKIKEINQ